MTYILIFFAMAVVPVTRTTDSTTDLDMDMKEPFDCLTCHSIYKRTREKCDAKGNTKHDITVTKSKTTIKDGATLREMIAVKSKVDDDRSYHCSSAEAIIGSKFELDTSLQGEDIECYKSDCPVRCYSFVLDESYKAEPCNVTRRNHTSSKNGIVHFEKIAYVDSGLYLFTNGEEISTVLLQVTNGGPENVDQNVDFVSKKAGEKVILKCAWENATVDWMKNGVVIEHRPELILERLDSSQSGEYTCTVCYDSNCKSHKFVLNIDEYVESASFPTWVLVIIVGLLIIITICSFLIIRKRMNILKVNNNKATFINMVHVSQNVFETEEAIQMPIVRIEPQRRRAVRKGDTELYYEFPVDTDWEFPRERLILGPKLGEGEFAKVFKAEALGIVKESSGATTVAVKMLREEALTDTSVKNFVCELEVMKMIDKHPNIINLLGCCSANGPLYVIVEYAPHGDLRNFLRMHRPVESNEESALTSEPKSLSIQQLISFALQIARGMEYLAFKKCVHRDLAARNVLVAENYVMKISDFGMARDVLDKDYYRKLTNEKIAMRWIAPESMKDRFFNSQSDVWSFGVLFWEIMTLGDKPYVGWNLFYEQLQRGERLSQPDSCPDNVYQLMTECWQFKAQKRPTFSGIIKKLEGISGTMNNAEAPEQ